MLPTMKINPVTYLVCVEEVLASTLTVNVGECTGPFWQTTLKANPGLISFKVLTAFFAKVGRGPPAFFLRLFFAGEPISKKNIFQKSNMLFNWPHNTATKLVHS